MDKTLSLIGLAYRANKVYLGEQCLEHIRELHFLFIAADASVKTRERYLKKCRYYHLDHCLDYSAKEISKALGRNNIRIIGISDEGFSRSIHASMN